MSSLNSSVFLRSDFSDEDILTLDRPACERILDDDESTAFACLLAAACLLEGDILDEEGQPYSERELGLMLERKDSLAVGRATGLLFALSGEEFLNDPRHFRRICSSVIEGDVFAYEDEDEEPSVPDVLWTLFQASLLTEDDLMEEIGPRVQRYIKKLQEEEVEDLDARQKEGDTEDPDYVTETIRFRLIKLAEELKELKVPGDLVDNEDLQGLLLNQSNESVPRA